MTISDDTVSHILVHLIPIENNREFYVEFASAYICRLVTAKYLQNETDAFLRFLRVFRSFYLTFIVII
jgi:hypothetical protein